MAFRLAEAYVQIGQRGMAVVLKKTDGLAARLKATLSPVNVLNRGFTGLISPVRSVASGVSRVVSRLQSMGTDRIRRVREALTGLLRPVRLLQMAMAGGLFAGFVLGPTLKLAAEVETLSTSFEVLLGSADKAKRMMEEVNAFAASTPFEQQELAGVAKQLLAFGTAQENIIPTMTRLGDISALSVSAIGDLAAIYGKVRGTGRMMTETLDQFLERGIPIGRELAKMFGVPEAAIRKMASEGKISFADFERALGNLTTGSGQFAGGMAKLSQTLGGLWSTITGNVKNSLADIGMMIVETFDLKPVLKRVGEFAGQFAKLYGQRIREILGDVRDFAEEAWGRISGVIGQAIGIITGNAENLGDVLGGLKTIGLAVLDFLASAAGVVLTLADPLLAVAGAVGRWIVRNRELISQVARIGGVIVGAVVAAKGLVAIVGALGAALGMLLSPIGLVAVAIGGLAALFPDFFKSVLADLGDLIRDWDIYWRLGMEHTKLFLANSWERFKTFFVNVGEIATWFFGDWKEIFVTLGDFTATLFTNLIENIKGLWQSLLNWIRGEQWEFNATPLLDGFKSSIQEMPQLTEANVQKTNDRIEELYGQLGKRMADRRAKADKQAAAAAAGGESGTGEKGAPGPAGGDSPGKGGKYEFVGLAQLAEKMQQEAARANEQAKANALAEKTAGATEKLATAVEGGALKVKMSDAKNQQMAPNPMPAWG